MKRFQLLCLTSLFACKDTRVSEMNETLDELKSQIVQTRTYVGMDDSAEANADGEENTTEDQSSLRNKVAQLEAELATVKSQLATTRQTTGTATATRTTATSTATAATRKTPAAAGARQAMTQAQGKQQEAQAQRLLKEITDLMAKNQFGPAKQKLQLMKTRLGNTLTYKKAQASVLKELALIGRPSPKNIESKKWFNKKGPIDLTKGVTVIFFWEVWCPECVTELPKMNTIYKTLRKQGLKAVTLSRLTRNSTEKQLRDFLKKNKISLPAALDDGRYSNYFKVSGIPAAAIVKNGKVVWRGHPKGLNSAQVAAFLK